MTSLGHRNTWSWRPGWQRPAGTHRRAGVVPSAEVEAALLIHRVVDAGQLWGLRPGGRKGVIEEAVIGAASGDKEVSRLRLGFPRCNERKACRNPPHCSSAVFQRGFCPEPPLQQDLASARGCVWGTPGLW